MLQVIWATDDRARNQLKWYRNGILVDVSCAKFPSSLIFCRRPAISYIVSNAVHYDAPMSIATPRCDSYATRTLRTVFGHVKRFLIDLARTIRHRARRCADNRRRTRWDSGQTGFKQAGGRQAMMGCSSLRLTRDLISPGDVASTDRRT